MARLDPSMFDQDPASISAAPDRHQGQEGFSSWSPFWTVIILFLLGVALIIMAYSLYAVQGIRSRQRLPVDLRSSLQADYGFDPVSFSLAPLRDHIYWDVLHSYSAPGTDRPAGSSSPADALGFPVPTVTPVPTFPSP